VQIPEWTSRPVLGSPRFKDAAMTAVCGNRNFLTSWHVLQRGELSSELFAAVNRQRETAHHGALVSREDRQRRPGAPPKRLPPQRRDSGAVLHQQQLRYARPASAAAVREGPAKRFGILTSELPWFSGQEAAAALGRADLSDAVRRSDPLADSLIAIGSGALGALLQ